MKQILPSLTGSDFAAVQAFLAAGGYAAAHDTVRRTL